MINILVIASLKPTTTANYIVTALKNAGHQLLVISDVKNPAAQLIEGVVDVERVCKKNNFKPNLILFVEGGSMQVLPLGLEKINCISAWYGIDTHMDYQKHLLISELFDVTFVAQKEYVEKLRTDGIKQVYWLPLAFPAELFPEKKLNRDIDISYVGSNNVNINPHRHKLLSMLKENFQSTRFGLASPKEMGEIYSISKAVFNKSVNNDINMRFFEAMGCGAVLITDPIIDNGLEDLFEENKHYISYKNDDELVQKTKELLSSPDLLNQISQNAQALIFEKHTYLNRAHTILEISNHASNIARPQPTDYFSALLALKLYAPALNMCATAFKKSSLVGFRRYVSQSIALVLFCFSKLVGLLELLLNKTSK